MPTPFHRHPDQPARHQPAHDEAHPFGGPVETVAALQRQHPGDAALIEVRLDRDEDADHEDHHHRGDRAQGARHGRAEPAERAHQLAAELLDVDPAGKDAHAVRPGNQAIGLDGDALAKQSGLGHQLGAGEIADPGDEADCRQGDDREPPAAADRQHATEQASAAVEHRRKDDAGEDQQQRLREQR